MESLSGLEFFLGQKVDSVFYLVLLAAIGSFIIAETLWVVRKSWKPKGLHVPKQHVEVIWSLIPAVILLLLTFVRGGI